MNRRRGHLDIWLGCVPCLSCSHDLKLGNLLGLFQKAGFLHTDSCVNTSGSRVKSVGRVKDSQSLILWDHPTPCITLYELIYIFMFQFLHL